MGLTLPCLANCEARAISANAKPANNRPAENFAGLEGSRLPSDTHNIANSGASTITIAGCTDWYHAEGNSNPRTTLSVSRSANRFRLVPACSNDIQKTIENRKR